MDDYHGGICKDTPSSTSKIVFPSKQGEAHRRLNVRLLSPYFDQRIRFPNEILLVKVLSLHYVNFQEADIPGSAMNDSKTVARQGSLLSTPTYFKTACSDVRLRIRAPSLNCMNLQGTASYTQTHITLGRGKWEEGSPHLTERSSRLLAGDSGRIGNTMRLGQTSRLVSVSLRNGSSHSLTRPAEAPPPKALPKLRLKWIRGGLLHIWHKVVSSGQKHTDDVGQETLIY